jgi:hypothetical protein
MTLVLSQLKGGDVMRRSVARHAHAYRHDAPKQEGPTPSIVVALLSAGRGKSLFSFLGNQLSVKPRQEVVLLPGPLIPVQQSHTRTRNLIIRLFCADFNKGVRHERTTAESISDSGKE